MAAVGLRVGGMPPSGSPEQAAAAAELRAAKRGRQRAARHALQGRLSAALARIEQLEQELAAAIGDKQHEHELHGRLALVAPVLAAHMEMKREDSKAATTLMMARRNAASHCFDTSVEKSDT